MTNFSKSQAKAELAKRELARRHLKNFAEYTYDGYMSNWHTEQICEALELVEKGEIRFLFIEAPPRHSKSIHVSQLFPAWAMGRNENADIIVSSYSGDLATTHGRETRNLMGERKYKNVFDTRLAGDSTAKGKFNTGGKGAYNAVGVGGSTTGKGAKFFIVDDSLKDRKEAESEVIREGIWDWFRSVARTRLTPDGAMVVMQTRWHESDIIGKLLEEDPWVDWWDYKENGLGDAKWVRLCLPAFATTDEPYRKNTEPLWPSRYDAAELEDIKKSLGPYEFSALYQQNPVDEGSREFKTEWFKYRTMDDISRMTVRRFATIDPNLKKSDKSDYCGVVRNYVNSDGQWNLRGARYRVNSKEVIDLVFMLHDEGFEKIGIEEGAFSYVVEPFLQEEMRKRGKFPNVVPLKHNQTMKETRIRGLIPWFAGHMVYFIEGEVDDLLTEMLAFPKGTHDDVVDACAYQIQLAEAPASMRDQLIFENAQHESVANASTRLGL